MHQTLLSTHPPKEEEEERDPIKMSIKDHQRQLKDRVVANPKTLQVHVQSM